MNKYGLLSVYSKCDGCGKCIDSCCRTHGFTPEQSGLKISISGPFTFHSGKIETYYIAAPTDFCDRCKERDIPACAQVCPHNCIIFGKVEELGENMTEKKMALFTITDSVSHTSSEEE